MLRLKIKVFWSGNCLIVVVLIFLGREISQIASPGVLCVCVCCTTRCSFPAAEQRAVLVFMQEEGGRL